MNRSRRIVPILLLALSAIQTAGCYPGEAGTAASLHMSLAALEINATDVRGWLDWLDDGQPGAQRPPFGLSVDGNFFLVLNIVKDNAAAAVPLGGGTVTYQPETSDLLVVLQVDDCTDCRIDSTMFWIRADQSTKTYTGISTPFSVAGGLLASDRPPEINAVTASTGTLHCVASASMGVGSAITLAALDQAEQVRFRPVSGTVTENGLQIDLPDIPILRSFMVQRQTADGTAYTDVEQVTLQGTGEARTVNLP
jgi:hypothetical protein